MRRFYACGYGGYNYQAFLWLTGLVTHSPVGARLPTNVQLVGFARVYAQLSLKMYTVCAQLFDEFASVNTALVHTVHMAYKEHGKVNKGNII